MSHYKNPGTPKRNDRVLSCIHVSPYENGVHWYFVDMNIQGPDPDKNFKVGVVRIKWICCCEDCREPVEANEEFIVGEVHTLKKDILIIKSWIQ